MTLFVS
jgi:hypothetical protein